MARKILGGALPSSVVGNKCAKTNRRLLSVTAWMLLLGCIEYFVFTHVAMVLYPGGNALNDMATGYSYWYNYYSDLGMAHAWNGAANLLSASFFIPSVVTWALMKAPFFIVLPRKIFPSGWLHTLSVFSGIGEVGSSITAVGIALTPHDMMHQAHVIFVSLAILFMGLTAISCSLLLLKSSHKKVGVAFSIHAITCIMYGLVFIAPYFTSVPRFVLLTAACQKIIFFTWLGSSAFLAMRFVRLPPESHNL